MVTLRQSRSALTPLPSQKFMVGCGSSITLWLIARFEPGGPLSSLILQ